MTRTTERRDSERLALRRPGSSRRSAGARAESRLAYLLLLPTVFAVALLVFVPLVWNAVIAVQELRLIDLRDANIFNPFAIEFSLVNFVKVVSAPDFVPLILRTLLYAGLGAAGATVVGLWAALALRRPFPGRSVVRALVFVPYVLPLIAATFLWKTMLAPQYGVVNAWAGALFGTERIDFLGRRTLDVEVLGIAMPIPLAFVMVVLFDTWRYFPFAYIFVLARLQAVPKTLEEAAIVDGATISQRFRHVVLPQLGGVLLLVFLIRFMSGFNEFSNIYLLTGGGAGTDVVSVQIYNWLVGRADPGAAAALALVLAVVLALCVTAYFRLAVRKRDLA